MAMDSTHLLHLKQEDADIISKEWTTLFSGAGIGTY